MSASLLDTSRVSCILPPFFETLEADAANTSAHVYVTLSRSLVDLLSSDGDNSTYGSSMVSTSSAPFGAYPQAHVSHITPEHSRDGNVVYVYGGGFEGFSTVSPAWREQYLTCSFGPDDRRTLSRPIWHNDTLIICPAPWPAIGLDGLSLSRRITGDMQRVRVALNGQTLEAGKLNGQFTPEPIDDDVPAEYRLAMFTFTYSEIHVPQLRAAYFSADRNLLLIEFDAQPTDRAGVNGIVPCTQLLDMATSAHLQGCDLSLPLPLESGTCADLYPPNCGWRDESTIVVYLRALTNIVGGNVNGTAGLTLGLRGDVIRPRDPPPSAPPPPPPIIYEFNASLPPTLPPASPPLLVDFDEYAAPALVISTNFDFPCDIPYTREVEICTPPTALLNAPNTLSGCADASITLDGSRSFGGGNAQLVYRWLAVPRVCDNVPQIQARLDALGSVPVVTLRASELAGGFTFSVRLIVVDVLGVPSPATIFTVTRAVGPVPTMSIDADPTLSVGWFTPIALPARASLPLCYNASALGPWAERLASSDRVGFRWEIASARVLPGYSFPFIPPVPLDEGSMRTRLLRFSGSGLRVGVEYTLRVVGCLKISRLDISDLCGAAETRVTLRDEPLTGGIQGGDRTVGDRTPFTVHACNTIDVDDPAARCDANKFCGSLQFAWSCRHVVDGVERNCPFRVPRENRCNWDFHTRDLGMDLGTRTVTQDRGPPLAADTYTFYVTVTKSQGGADSLTTSSVVDVISLPVGSSLPELEIIPPSLQKLNPGARLAFTGALSGMVGITRDPITYTDLVAYEWSITPPVVNLTNTGITVTGAYDRVLALWPNTLDPGAVYVFTLRAAYIDPTPNGTYPAVVASYTAVINRPPFGGQLNLAYSWPAVALTTPVQVTAVGWSDDVTPARTAHALCAQHTLSAPHLHAPRLLPTHPQPRLSRPCISPRHHRTRPTSR